MTAQVVSLAPDKHFLAHSARLLLERFGSIAEAGDLSHLNVILPNLLLAQSFGLALSQEAGGALLLPRMETLSGALSPWAEAMQPEPEASRALALHALLRQREWLDESMLWDVVGELTALFDHLTEHALALPQDEAAWLAQLERAYALRDSRHLGFEARLAHALWLAEARGRPSRTLARALSIEHWADHLRGPLVVLAEDYVDVARNPLLTRLVSACAQRVPVLVLQADRVCAEGDLAAAMQAAWPTSSERLPMLERARALPAESARAAAQHLACLVADSLEALAAGVADTVCDWLRAGRTRIALVVADRLAARRARALLERENVLVQDETGWKMSTTRVAAMVDAWIETLASDAYHRAVVDLARSSFAFADMPEPMRSEAILQMERSLARMEIPSGLDAMLMAFGAEPKLRDGAALLTRLVEARRAMPPNGNHTIATWLDRLQHALQVLGAAEAIAGDAAGMDFMDWLQTRRGELAEDKSRFTLGQWRNWFNREMDASLFRDRSIASPVVMTHLAATRLRDFEAAIIIGADSEHLVAENSNAWLAHEGVRRELGLPGRELARQRLREDIAGLALACDEIVIAWQGSQRDEPRLPAPDVDVLLRVLEQAGSGPLVRRYHAAAQDDVIVAPRPRPMPAASVAQLPAQLSPSALASLLNCPYQFYARYVLRLSELDELGEALEKRDFGELVHRILQAFHAEYPHLEGHDDATLVEALSRHTDAVFAPIIAANFLEHAWRMRWRSRLAAYVAWQRAREQQGWRVLPEGSEAARSRPLILPDGGELKLRGRLDRVDTNGEAIAVLDYKTRPLDALKRQVADADDVQLAFYALLCGEHVKAAAYVSLDDDRVEDVAVDDPQAAAQALEARIADLFTRLRAGAGMPAHGAEASCAHCEMRGLCRRDWQA